MLAIILGHICLLGISLVCSQDKILHLVIKCLEYNLIWNWSSVFLLTWTILTNILLKSSKLSLCGMSLILYLRGVFPWLDSHYSFLTGVLQMWCVLLSASTSSHMICPSICPNIWVTEMVGACQFLHSKVSIFFLYNSYVLCCGIYLRHTCAVS